MHALMNLVLGWGIDNSPCLKDYNQTQNPGDKSGFLLVDPTNSNPSNVQVLVLRSSSLGKTSYLLQGAWDH